MKNMKNYYFTFGSAHVTKAGINMQDRWVRVLAPDFMTARKKFIEKFTSVNMEAPDKFAFQYDDKNFESKYFPGGEYLVIE